MLTIQSTLCVSTKVLKSRILLRDIPAFDSTLGGCSTSHRKYGWDHGSNDAGAGAVTDVVGQVRASS